MILQEFHETVKPFTLFTGGGPGGSGVLVSRWEKKYTQVLRAQAEARQALKADRRTGLDGFSHIDDEGKVKMVDVSGKPVSKRTAVASGLIRMAADTVAKLREGTLKKGDALATARVAGIMGAKKTSSLIPLCHPLPIDDIAVRLELMEDAVEIEAAVTSTARTGVEMEALTAVSVAALTLYDMCKAVDKGMIIENITLRSKTKEEA